MAAIQEYVRKVYYIIEKWETAFVVSFFFNLYDKTENHENG